MDSVISIYLPYNLFAGAVLTYTNKKTDFYGDVWSLSFLSNIYVWKADKFLKYINCPRIIDYK